MAARTAPPKSPGGGRSSPVLTAGTFLILIYAKSIDSGMFLTFAPSFVTDRVRTAYYVYLSHLAESKL